MRGTVAKRLRREASAHYQPRRTYRRLKREYKEGKR